LLTVFGGRKGGGSTLLFRSRMFLVLMCGKLLSADEIDWSRFFAKLANGSAEEAGQPAEHPAIPTSPQLMLCGR